MQVHSANRFTTFAELKDYIYTTLCELEQLAVGAFPITWQILKRGTEKCGVLFSVQGPRSVVFNAVFETDGNTIHFYNSAGERVLSQPVSHSRSLLG